jgi:hypothetical protein
MASIAVVALALLLFCGASTAAGHTAKARNQATTQASPDRSGEQSDTGSVSPAVAYGAGWISALLAGMAFISASRRKPRIRLFEGSEPNGPEWIAVTAVIGRRAIDVQEVGLVLAWGPPWSRRRYWHPGPSRPSLPKYLSDGAVIEVGFEVSGLIDDLSDAVDEAVRTRATTQPYLAGSGKKYRGRGSMGLRTWVTSLVRSFRVAENQ